MPILEKAFAKLHGNYDRIIAGSGKEGLRYFTGAPTFILSHSGHLKNFYRDIP